MKTPLMHLGPALLFAGLLVSSTEQASASYVVITYCGTDAQGNPFSGFVQYDSSQGGSGGSFNFVGGKYHQLCFKACNPVQFCNSNMTGADPFNITTTSTTVKIVASCKQCNEQVTINFQGVNYAAAGGTLTVLPQGCFNWTSATFTLTKGSTYLVHNASITSYSCKLYATQQAPALPPFHVR